MIAIYFHPKYRDNIKKFFKKLNVRCPLKFQTSYHSVYFVKNDMVFCVTKNIFKRKYPEVKIIDLEKIYEEY